MIKTYQKAVGINRGSGYSRHAAGKEIAPKDREGRSRYMSALSYKEFMEKVNDRNGIFA